EPKNPVATFWLLWRNRRGALRWHFCARLSGEVRSICTFVRVEPGRKHPEAKVLDARRFPPEDSPHPVCKPWAALEEAELERAIAEDRAPIFRPYRLPYGRIPGRRREGP